MRAQSAGSRCDFTTVACLRSLDRFKSNGWFAGDTTSAGWEGCRSASRSFGDQEGFHLSINLLSRSILPAAPIEADGAPFARLRLLKSRCVYVATLTLLDEITSCRRRRYGCVTGSLKPVLLVADFGRTCHKGKDKGLVWLTRHLAPCRAQK
jgi:hypothetical protein